MAFVGIYIPLQRDSSTALSPVNAVPVDRPQVATIESGLGPRHQLTYQQWVSVLEREATVMADQRPDRLNILLGDSLSLWFPSHLLPTDRTWLNQGISGETSYGVLKRIKLLDKTRPRIIFLMIGINDLIRGVSDETVLANQREIVRYLKQAHPTTRIVMQSILPHGGDRTLKQYAALSSVNASEPQKPPVWVERLPYLSNTMIRTLNQRLAIVAQEEGAEFLDLHPLFVDSQGNLQDRFTTDGLHLSLAGYQAWKSQLEKIPDSPPQADIPSL
ncbi:GDSL-type esterase/lipase family protein [Leptodesmis sp.]|uniref:GDSL-type esterase/lipase family protein n=1 Tax=Leptodesmis sp. TaxID=3100501 RepID=UPI0040534728